MSFEDTTNRTSSVTTPVAARGFLNAHTFFMAACCLAMLAGTGLLIYSAPSGLTWTETLLLAGPMLGCVAMHAVLHRFMGKSCQATNKTGANQ